MIDNFAVNRSVNATLLSLVLVFILLSCGGGGGGDGEGGLPSVLGGTSSVSKNLSASDLVVETVDPRIGYPMKVSVTLATNEATEKVSVSLFAIDNNDDPAMEVRQIPLGSQTIAQMDAGARSFEIDASIPSSVEFPGAYFIAAIIDPVEEVAETNEDDNTAIQMPLVSIRRLKLISVWRSGFRLGNSHPNWSKQRVKTLPSTM